MIFVPAAEERWYGGRRDSRNFVQRNCNPCMLSTHPDESVISPQAMLEFDSPEKLSLS